MRPQPTALVVGDLDVARRTCASLGRHGYAVRHVGQPSDERLSHELTRDVEAVVVLVRGDVTALRYALFIEHVLPGVRLVVTLFDRTVAQQLVDVVPNCVVTSPAEIAVPSLVAACLGDGASATRPGLRRLLDLVSRQCRPYDATTRAVVGGVVALLALVALDCGIGVTVLNLPPWQAFYAAARTVATVGPGEGGGRLPGWYLAYSALAVLATIVVTAVFTASVVNYLHSPRSVRLFGRLARPVRGHVVVVGLGQVGLRLCTELKAAGVPVVAVERDPTATNLRLARLAGVPVLIAHAEDRAVLSRVGLDRAVALAAMGSDELDNVEVAIAALGVCPDLRVVLRAGESDVIAETRSLFHIGEVSNVSAITADRVTQLVAADKRAITTAPLTPDVRCGCL